MKLNPAINPIQSFTSGKRLACLVLLASALGSLANASIATTATAGATNAKGSTTAPLQVQSKFEDANAVVNAEAHIVATQTSVTGTASVNVSPKLTGCDNSQTCPEYGTEAGFAATVTDNLHLTTFPGSVGLQAVILKYTSFLGSNNPPPTSVVSGHFCAGPSCVLLAAAASSISIPIPASGTIPLSINVNAMIQCEFGAGHIIPNGQGSAEFQLTSIDVYDKNGKLTSSFFYSSDSGATYPIAGIHLFNVGR